MPQTKRSNPIIAGKSTRNSTPIDTPTADSSRWLYGKSPGVLRAGRGVPPAHMRERKVVGRLHTHDQRVNFTDAVTASEE